MGVIKWFQRKPSEAPAGEWPARREMDWTMREGTRTKRVESRLRSSKATELEWVHKETGEVRCPREREKKFLRGLPFRAAGRSYFSLDQLTARCKGQYGSWYLDCYGRPVLLVLERFPCFDSSDFLNEHRFYRWFLICRNGVLTLVRATDGEPDFSVTEDAAFLEHDCWNELKNEGCLDRW